MSKGRAVTIWLPEDLLAQVDAATDNRSELVRQVLERHFGRRPTEQEIALAIEWLAQRAREAAQEGDDGRTARQSTREGADGPLGREG